jgi:hypothetical protein
MRRGQGESFGGELPLDCALDVILEERISIQTGITRRQRVSGPQS